MNLSMKTRVIFAAFSYFQVNRWFANRRRKQTKRRKTETESPHPLTSSSVAVSNCVNGLTDQEQGDLSWPKSISAGWYGKMVASCVSLHVRCLGIS